MFDYRQREESRVRETRPLPLILKVEEGAKNRGMLGAPL